MAALLSMLKMADEKRIDFVIFAMNQKIQILLEKVFARNYVPLLTEEEFRSVTCNLRTVAPQFSALNDIACEVINEYACFKCRN